MLIKLNCTFCRREAYIERLRADREWHERVIRRIIERGGEGREEERGDEEGKRLGKVIILFKG